VNCAKPFVVTNRKFGYERWTDYNTLRWPG